MWLVLFFAYLPESLLWLAPMAVIAVNGFYVIIFTKLFSGGGPVKPVY